MKSFNSKLIVMIGLLIAISGTWTEASAHGPSSVNLTFDVEIQILTVSISHSVSDPATHYISSVEIYINTILNQSNSYTSQPTSNQFDYEYNLNVTDGDVIDVKAICSLSGSRTQSLTVQSEVTTSTNDTTDTTSDTSLNDDGTSTISGMGVLNLASFSMIVVVMILQSRKGNA